MSRADEILSKLRGEPVTMRKIVILVVLAIVILLVIAEFGPSVFGATAPAGGPTV
jgi:hypothetical protein